MVSTTSVGQLSALAGQNHQLLLVSKNGTGTGPDFLNRNQKNLLFQEPDLESGSGSICV
jgi:hypothetical protein